MMKYVLSFDEVKNDKLPIRSQERVRVDEKEDFEEAGVELFHHY